MVTFPLLLADAWGAPLIFTLRAWRGSWRENSPGQRGSPRVQATCGVQTSVEVRCPTSCAASWASVPGKPWAPGHTCLSICPVSGAGICPLATILSGSKKTCWFSVCSASSLLKGQSDDFQAHSLNWKLLVLVPYQMCDLQIFSPTLHISFQFHDGVFGSLDFPISIKSNYLGKS